MNKPTSPADLDASQPPIDADDHPELAAQHSRVALILFAVYLLGYGGFMGLAAFSPQAMGQPALWGVNLAIIYGLGLIFGAVVLALVYMVACRLISSRFHS